VCVCFFVYGDFLASQIMPTKVRSAKATVEICSLHWAPGVHMQSYRPLLFVLAHYFPPPSSAKRCAAVVSTTEAQRLGKETIQPINGRNTKYLVCTHGLNSLLSPCVPSNPLAHVPPSCPALESRVWVGAPLSWPVPAVEHRPPQRALPLGRNQKFS